MSSSLFGEKAIELEILQLQKIICKSLVVVFQSLMVLSSELDASNLSNDAKLTELTKIECSSRICCKTPVAVFQSLMIVFQESDASNSSCDAKASEVIVKKCPSRVCRKSFVINRRSQCHLTKITVKLNKIMQNGREKQVASTARLQAEWALRAL